MGVPTIHLSRKNIEQYHIFPCGSRRASQVVNGVMDGFYSLINKRKPSIRKIFTDDELLFLSSSSTPELYYSGNSDDTIARIRDMMALDPARFNVDTKNIEEKVNNLEDVGLCALMETLADIREESGGRY